MAHAEGVLIHPTHPVCVIAYMGEAYRFVRTCKCMQNSTNVCVQSMNRGACGTNKLSLHPITARWKVTGMGQVVLGWDGMCRVEMCRAGLNAGLRDE